MNMNKTESNGLIAAYVLDGFGGAREIGRREIDAWQADQGLLWVHLNFENLDEQKLGQIFPGLPETVVEAILADETRPRSELIGDGLLAVLRGVNTNPGADPEDMVSIRMWLEPTRIITTRRRRLLSVDDIRNHLKKGKGPRTADDLLTQLVERLNLRIGNVIDELEESIDNLEIMLAGDSSKIRHVRSEISELRRQCARLRRYLAPQRDALDQLSRYTGDLLSQQSRLELREQTDRLRRYVEDLDLARERAMVAHEQLLAQISEEQNSRMYILSVVAAIFLPLTFITGLLGMNVGGIPGEGLQGAFWLLIIAMGVSAVALFVLFRWRKWL